MYFKMVAESKDEMANIGSMQYYVKGDNIFYSRGFCFKLWSTYRKKLVHSSTCSVLMDPQEPLPLLVLSPNHGMVEYLWEYKSNYSQQWCKLEVPTTTCLLYIDTVRKYKCTVDGNEVIFYVKGW